MTLDPVPIRVFFVGTVLLVMLSIELSFRLGNDAHRKSDVEKESPAGRYRQTVASID